MIGRPPTSWTWPMVSPRRPGRTPGNGVNPGWPEVPLAVSEAVGQSVGVGCAADRARRGGSGALSPAIRSSGAERPSEGRGLRGRYVAGGVDGQVPRNARPRTRSDPEGSSLKRQPASAADQPDQSQPRRARPEDLPSTVGRTVLPEAAQDGVQRPGDSRNGVGSPSQVIAG